MLVGERTCPGVRRPVVSRTFGERNATRLMCFPGPGTPPMLRNAGCTRVPPICGSAFALPGSHCPPLPVIPQASCSQCRGTRHHPSVRIPVFLYTGVSGHRDAPSTLHFSRRSTAMNPRGPGLPGLTHAPGRAGERFAGDRPLGDVAAACRCQATISAAQKVSALLGYSASDRNIRGR